MKRQSKSKKIKLPLKLNSLAEFNKFFSKPENTILNAIKNERVDVNSSLEKHNFLDGACWKNYMEVALFLVKERGMDITLNNNRKVTLLHKACENEHLALVEYLITEKKVDINAKDIIGETSLHSACRNDNLEIIKFLLEHNINVNDGDLHSNTPLHVACWNKKIEIVKYLSKNGADIEAQSLGKNTPLNYACWQQSFEITQWLVEEKKASLRIENIHQETPIMSLCKQPVANFDLLNYLFNKHNSLTHNELIQLATKQQESYPLLIQGFCNEIYREFRKEFAAKMFVPFMLSLKIATKENNLLKQTFPKGLQKMIIDFINLKAEMTNIFINKFTEKFASVSNDNKDSLAKFFCDHFYSKSIINIEISSYNPLDIEKLGAFLLIGDSSALETEEQGI
jgi:ankyrin repeat protein